MNYDNAGLQSLWTAAGGSGAIADTMAAIALAESSGNPTDANLAPSEGRSGSWGLWQINRDAHPQYDQNSLLNPKYNATAAVAVEQSQGLGAWSTYTHDTAGNYVGPGSTSAAYHRFLSGSSSSSIAGVPAGASTSIISQVVQVTQTSENPLTLLNSWITNPKVDVLYKAVALCIVLIVLGAIPQTQRWAGWASLCILFVLLIQTQKTTTG